MPPSPRSPEAAPSPWAFVGAAYRCEAAADTDNGGVRDFDFTDILFDGDDVGDALCVGAVEDIILLDLWVR